MSWKLPAPFIVPILATGVYGFFTNQIHNFLSTNKVDMQVVFDGFFNLSAILTGFLFTIYCFLAVSSNPFIEKLQETKTFAEVKNCLMLTTVISFSACLISLVFSAFDLHHANEYEKMFLMAWVFIITLSVSYFIHCLQHFMIISRDTTKPRIPGG